MAGPRPRWRRALQSRLTLLSALILNILRRLMGRPGGAARWLRHLFKERLAATPPVLWDMAAGTSGCLGCGLCDSVASEPNDDIALWIQSDARRPEDADLATSHAQRLRVLAEDIAKVCPARLKADAVATVLTVYHDTLCGAEDASSR